MFSVCWLMTKQPIGYLKTCYRFLRLEIAAECENGQMHWLF